MASALDSSGPDCFVGSEITAGHAISLSEKAARVLHSAGEFRQQLAVSFVSRKVNAVEAAKTTWINPEGIPVY